MTHLDHLVQSLRVRTVWGWNLRACATVVAALAFAGVVTGCGDEEGDPARDEDSITVSAGATLASDLLDLHAQALAALQAFADADADAGEAAAQRRVQGLANDATQLANDASGPDGPALADAANCTAAALTKLADVMGGEPGTEAQAAIADGVEALGACLARLKTTVSELSDAKADADALLARIESLVPDDSLLASLQETLAGVVAPVTPDAEPEKNPNLGLQECGTEGVTTGEPCLTPDGTAAGETADLPVCTPDLPPGSPCRP